MCAALTDKELGVVQVVLERYNREWLPALLDMKAKVDRGDTLDEREVALLKKAMDEANSGVAFARSHTEFRSLVDKATRLYDHIEAKHQENSNLGR